MDKITQKRLYESIGPNRHEVDPVCRDLAFPTLPEDKKILEQHVLEKVKYPAENLHRNKSQAEPF